MRALPLGLFGLPTFLSIVGAQPATLPESAHRTTALPGFLQVEADGCLVRGVWTGHADPEAVRETAEAVLPLLRNQGQSTCLLTDTSGVTGDWSDLVPWLAFDYLPRLRAVGIRRLALVRPPNPATRLACAAQAGQITNLLEVGCFDDATAARTWLVA